MFLFHPHWCCSFLLLQFPTARFTFSHQCCTTFRLCQTRQSPLCDQSLGNFFSVIIRFNLVLYISYARYHHFTDPRPCRACAVRRVICAAISYVFVTLSSTYCTVFVVHRLAKVFASSWHHQSSALCTLLTLPLPLFIVPFAVHVLGELFPVGNCWWWYCSLSLIQSSSLRRDSTDHWAIFGLSSS